MKFLIILISKNKRALRAEQGMYPKKLKYTLTPMWSLRRATVNIWIELELNQIQAQEVQVIIVIFTMVYC